MNWFILLYACRRLVKADFELIEVFARIGAYFAVQKSHKLELTPGDSFHSMIAS
jgi:hypothetical protein